MKLTLDQKVTYQIRVPGEIRNDWFDWDDKIEAIVDHEIDNYTITTLTCILDQAGLHGLLRLFYSMGLPLISVICTEYYPIDK